MIRVFYKGVDVTESVSVNACIHEMWAAGCLDTLHIRFNDAAKLWDTWAPQAGDEIRVDFGSATTGTMFVHSASPENGLFDIRAMSAPASALTKTDKAWSQVRLLQLGADIAARHGLKFTAYGVTDRIYPYMVQEGVSDFAFLHQRAMLEGCAFLVYNKTLVLYDIAAMEAQDALETMTMSLDGEFRYKDAHPAFLGLALWSLAPIGASTPQATAQNEFCALPSHSVSAPQTKRIGLPRVCCGMSMPIA